MRRLVLLVALGVLAVAVLPGLGLGTPGSPGPIGPEGIPVPIGPVLAPASSPALGQSVDGIRCQRTEQVLFHVHAHLTIFVNGKPRQIPYGIGIAPPLSGVNTKQGPFVTQGSCFSWLHTHALDGIIHIESPVQRRYLLGQFFDLWKQPLTRTRVGPARGRVVAFVDGRRVSADPRTIVLTKHAQIQLDVGAPVVAPVTITKWNGL